MAMYTTECLHHLLVGSQLGGEREREKVDEGNLMEFVLMWYLSKLSWIYLSLCNLSLSIQMQNHILVFGIKHFSHILLGAQNHSCGGLLILLAD